MNNMYIFGDSFSAGNGALSEDEYFKKYTKNVTDLIWPKILANEFKMNLFNYAFGGVSNDKILDTIIKTYRTLKKGDIVIIGKTFYHRFDIPNTHNTGFTTIAPNPENLLSSYYNDDEKEKIAYMSTLMDSKLFKVRQDSRFNFIKNILMERELNKCIIWDVQTTWNDYETIWKATDGEIKDHHWSYKGHKDFSEYILKTFFNGK